MEMKKETIDIESTLVIAKTVQMIGTIHVKDIIFKNSAISYYP